MLTFSLLSSYLYLSRLSSSMEMEKTFALCRDALKSSSFEEALTHALSILDDHQSQIDVDALRIACICHIYMNDLSAAREYAQKVNDKSLNLEKAYIEFLEGNYEKALTLCKEVVDDRMCCSLSVQTSCKYLLGQIYSQLRRYHEASEVYKSLERQYQNQKMNFEVTEEYVLDDGKDDYTSSCVIPHDLYTNLYASLIADNKASEALINYPLVEAINGNESSSRNIENSEEILESGYELYLNIALACIDNQSYDNSLKYLEKALLILKENKEMEDWDDERYSEELATLNLAFSYLYFLTGEYWKANKTLNDILKDAELNIFRSSKNKRKCVTNDESKQSTMEELEDDSTMEAPDPLVMTLALNNSLLFRGKEELFYTLGTIKHIFPSAKNRMYPHQVSIIENNLMLGCLKLVVTSSGEHSTSCNRRSIYGTANDTEKIYKYVDDSISEQQTATIKKLEMASLMKVCMILHKKEYKKKGNSQINFEDGDQMNIEISSKINDEIDPISAAINYLETFTREMKEYSKDMLHLRLFFCELLLQKEETKHDSIQLLQTLYFENRLLFPGVFDTLLTLYESNPFFREKAERLEKIEKLVSFTVKEIITVTVPRKQTSKDVIYLLRKSANVFAFHLENYEEAFKTLDYLLSHPDSLSIKLSPEEKVEVISLAIIFASYYDPDLAQTLSSFDMVLDLNHDENILTKMEKKLPLPRKASNSLRVNLNETNLFVDHIKRYGKSASCSFLSLSMNKIENIRRKSASSSLIWRAQDVERLSSNMKKGKISQRQKRDKKALLRHKLNQRTKKRLQYLELLTANGDYDPTFVPKPDPERWIAKSQRSYAKRKNKTKFVGAQGSGDGAQKDSDKLDVAKKVQLQKERDEEKARKDAERKAELAAKRRKASARRG